MANVVVSAIATFNGKALKKGQKEISAFDKSVKSLGKTFASVFAVGAITNFSKNAIKAFAADEAAAKSLEIQLNNTGYAFSAPGVELYIANLQKATGVLDDQLRPALQTILTASGSLTQSQKALAIALDIAAGTGKSVVEVSAAIAKGYTGQTTALSRLGAGISKTTLASGDMNKILDEASNKFSGQALARLDTYAGKMDVLKTSTTNASEIIGKGLLDSLSMLGKDQNIASLGTAMEKVATTIANVVVGLGAILGRVISIGSAIFSKLHLDKVIGFLYNNSLIAKLASFGASEATKPKSNFTYSLGSSAAADIARATEIKRIKDANKLRAAENAALKAKTELDKLKDKFDVERIGLTAALNAATDEETKLRISAKIAILDNNAALAKKINAELEAAKSATNLSDAFGTAANALTLQISKMQSMNDALIDKINAKIAAGAYTPPAGLNIHGVNTPLVNTPSMSPLVNANKIPAGAINPQTIFTDAAIGADLKIPATLAQSEYIMSAMSARLQAQADAYLKNQQEIKLTIDTSATGDRFAQLIAESLQAATKSGLSSTPVGLP